MAKYYSYHQGIWNRLGCYNYRKYYLCKIHIQKWLYGTTMKKNSMVVCRSHHGMGWEDVFNINIPYVILICEIL